MATVASIQVIDGSDAKRNDLSKTSNTVVSIAEVEASSPTTTAPTANKDSAELPAKPSNTTGTNAETQKPVPAKPAVISIAAKQAAPTQTAAAKPKPPPPGYKLIKRRRDDGTTITVLRKMTPEELEIAAEAPAKTPRDQKPATKAPPAGKADASKPAGPKAAKDTAPTNSAPAAQSTIVKVPAPAASGLTVASVAVGAAGAGAATVTLAESVVKLAESGNKIHAIITGRPLPATESPDTTSDGNASTAPTITANAAKPIALAAVKEATPSQPSLQSQTPAGVARKSVASTRIAPTSPQAGDKKFTGVADEVARTPTTSAVASKPDAPAQKPNVRSASAPSIPASTASQPAITAPDPANTPVSKPAASTKPAVGGITAPKTGTGGNAGRQTPDVPASAASQARASPSVQPGAKGTLSSTTTSTNTKAGGAAAVPKPPARSSTSGVTSAAPNANPSKNTQGTFPRTGASAPQRTAAPAPLMAANPAANCANASQIPMVVSAERVVSQIPPSATSIAGTRTAGVGCATTPVPQSLSPAACPKSTVPTIATRDVAQSNPVMAQAPDYTGGAGNDMLSATRAFYSNTAGAAVNAIPAVYPGAALVPQVAAAVLGVPVTSAAATPGTGANTSATEPADRVIASSPPANVPQPNGLRTSFDSILSQKHNTVQNNTHAGSSDQNYRDVSHQSGNNGGGQGRHDSADQNQMGRDHETQGYDDNNRGHEEDENHGQTDYDDQGNDGDHGERGLDDQEHVAEHHATATDNEDDLPHGHGEAHEGDVSYQDGAEHEDEIPYEDGEGQEGDIPYEEGEGQEGDIPYEEHEYAAEEGDIPYEDGEGQEGDIPYEEGEGQEGDIPYEEGEGQEGDIPHEEGEGQEEDIPYEEHEYAAEEGDIPFEEGKGQEGGIPYDEHVEQDGDIPYEGEAQEDDILYDGAEHETQEGDTPYEHADEDGDIPYEEGELPEEEHPSEEDHAADEEDYNDDYDNYENLDDTLEDNYYN